MNKPNYPEFLSSILMLFLSVLLGLVCPKEFEPYLLRGIFGFLVYLICEKLYDRKNQKP